MHVGINNEVILNHLNGLIALLILALKQSVTLAHLLKPTYHMKKTITIPIIVHLVVISKIIIITMRKNKPQ